MPRTTRTRRSVRRRPRRTTRFRRTIRRRRPTRSSRLTKRRINNVASVKKQDNMLTWVPTDSANNPGGPGAPGSLNLVATGNNTAFLFCPTARAFDSTETPEATRNNQTTFARGYKEITTFKVGGGTPWRRRRICFSAKGLPSLFLAGTSSFIPSFYFKKDSSIGYVRQLATLPTSQKGALHAILFKGTASNDWNDPMLAKVDTQRVNLHSDTTTVLNPGNANGMVKVHKDWYPLNKNITYSDDEGGTSFSTSEFSTQFKPGMGDFFVYDMYESILTSVTDQMNISHEGTYYWHEK